VEKSCDVQEKGWDGGKTWMAASGSFYCFVARGAALGEMKEMSKHDQREAGREATASQADRLVPGEEMPEQKGCARYADCRANGILTLQGRPASLAAGPQQTQSKPHSFTASQLHTTVSHFLQPR
jgi:hypothetical protein